MAYFALIGALKDIALRRLKAIADTRNNLVAGFGLIDSESNQMSVQRVFINS